MDEYDFQGAWSVADFARRHGIGRNSVFSEIKAGRLVARRAVGRKLIITSEDAREWRQGLPKAAARNQATSTVSSGAAAAYGQRSEVAAPGLIEEH
jgi:hypothetical protein